MSHYSYGMQNTILKRLISTFISVGVIILILGSGRIEERIQQRGEPGEEKEGGEAGSPISPTP